MCEKLVISNGVGYNHRISNLGTVMKRLLSAVLFLGWLSVGAVYAQAPLVMTASEQGVHEASIAPLLKKVMPAVVNILVQGRIPKNLLALLPPRQLRDLPDKGNFTSLGSGVIINAKKGYIITNAHVIQDAQTISVRLSDGRRYQAKKIGADKITDIAVLQIKATHLTSIPYANMNHVQVGDFVAAIGNPFGLKKTVTSGLISALHRSDLSIEGLENFIQTDAPINPGNSGGALVNMTGQLVGMNTAIIGPNGANVGIGFAIPSSMIKHISTQLIEYGSVKRGSIGVLAQDLTPVLARSFDLKGVKGALVTEVLPGSSAKKAGMKVGDVILGINDDIVDDASQLKTTIGVIRAGKTIEMHILRARKILKLKVIIQAKPKDNLTQTVDNLLEGTRLTNYTELRPGERMFKGVMVLDVTKTSVAWFSGLRPHDVIVAINGKAVTGVQEVRQQLQQKHKRLVIAVQRGIGRIFLVVSDTQ